MIHKSRIPDAARRGTMFELAITRLATWWSEKYFEVTESGHLRSRTFEDVHATLINKGFLDPNITINDDTQISKARAQPKSAKAKGKQKAVEPQPDWFDFFDEDEDIEIIRSEKSLMKHALQRSGSRDVSSQLFTALCRGLGIPARLVVSLQSVPWKANIGKSKYKPMLKKTKGSATPSGQGGSNYASAEDIDVLSATSLPGDGRKGSEASTPKGKGKAVPEPVIKLRKQRPKGRTVRAAKREGGRI